MAGQSGPALLVEVIEVDGTSVEVSPEPQPILAGMHTLKITKHACMPLVWVTCLIPKTTYQYEFEAVSGHAYKVKDTGEILDLTTRGLVGKRLQDA